MIREALSRILDVRDVIGNNKEIIIEAVRPGRGIRYVNYILTHSCDLQCPFCQVPKQKCQR